MLSVVGDLAAELNPWEKPEHYEPDCHDESNEAERALFEEQNGLGAEVGGPHPQNRQ